MGSVEGLYGKDDFTLGTQEAGVTLKDFHFLAVEEAHKLGVRVVSLSLTIELLIRWDHGTITLSKLQL